MRIRIALLAVVVCASANATLVTGPCQLTQGTRASTAEEYTVTTSADCTAAGLEHQSYGALSVGFNAAQEDLYFQEAFGFASYSQMATITGRPTGTMGFVLFQSLEHSFFGGETTLNHPTDEPIEFSFGTAFEIAGSLIWDLSEGAAFGREALTSMSIFDESMSLLQIFTGVADDGLGTFMLQAANAEYSVDAVHAPEPGTMLTVAVAIIGVYIWRRRYNGDMSRVSSKTEPAS